MSYKSYMYVYIYICIYIHIYAYVCIHIYIVIKAVVSSSIQVVSSYEEQEPAFAWDSLCLASPNPWPAPLSRPNVVLRCRKSPGSPCTLDRINDAPCISHMHSMHSTATGTAVRSIESVWSTKALLLQAVHQSQARHSGAVADAAETTLLQWNGNSWLLENDPQSLLLHLLLLLIIHLNEQIYWLWSYDSYAHQTYVWALHSILFRFAKMNLRCPAPHWDPWHSAKASVHALGLFDSKPQLGQNFVTVSESLKWKLHEASWNCKCNRKDTINENESYSFQPIGQPKLQVKVLIKPWRNIWDLPKATFKPERSSRWNQFCCKASCSQAGQKDILQKGFRRGCRSQLTPNGRIIIPCPAGTGLVWFICHRFQCRFQNGKPNASFQCPVINSFRRAGNFCNVWQRTEPPAFLTSLICYTAAMFLKHRHKT